MADIFISYAREDHERAKALAKALARQGWSVWWDRRIPTGRHFDDVIAEELAIARCVLVLWSKFSVLSPWVREEAADARDRNILAPLLVESARPPLGFRSLQMADLTTWKGDEQHPGFQQLLADIRNSLGASSASAEPRGTRERAAPNGSEEKSFNIIRGFALIYGMMFILVGIAGFIPDLVVPEQPDLLFNATSGHLFGIFPINLLQNLVRIVFGIWGIAAYRDFRNAHIYSRVVAIVYAILAVMGLIPVLNILFGLVPLYGPNFWLHALIALIAAYFGFTASAPYHPR